LPSTRTAETIGGICSISPTKAAVAATTSSAVNAISWVAVTSPEASRVEVSVPNTTSVT
jgi:hypothetical protein